MIYTGASTTCIQRKGLLWKIHVLRRKDQKTMNLGLKERVIIVTGASKGIGKAIAVAFAAEGSNVVLNARNQQELEQVAQEIQQSGGNALALAADVTNTSEIQRLVQQAIEHFGTIHVLVNNAG